MVNYSTSCVGFCCCCCVTNCPKFSGIKLAHSFIDQKSSKAVIKELAGLSSYLGSEGKSISELILRCRQNSAS